MRFKGGDIAAITAVLALAGVLWVCAASPDGARECVIELEGRTYAVYRLAECDPPKTVEIRTGRGTNTVVIDRGGAQVVESDCPSLEDVRRGKLTRAGDAAVCLPHRLVVRLTGSRGVDAVTE